MTHPAGGETPPPLPHAPGAPTFAGVEPPPLPAGPGELPPPLPGGSTSSKAASKVLASMLDRLFASISSGPSLNCRPHNSRQRIDLTQIDKLGDISAQEVLARILSPEASVDIAAKHAPPPDKSGVAPESEEAKRIESLRRVWNEQSGLLSKLRLLVEEARTYEDDTGVWVLNLGFPLLSLPPGLVGGRGGFGSRRVLAPVAFVPALLTVKMGASPSVHLECRSDEVDRVVPNEALLAWLQQQTGIEVNTTFEDPEGTNPWGEISELTRAVCGALRIPVPSGFEAPVAGQPAPAIPAVLPAPRSEELGEAGAVIPAAVLGLFPMANEGLLRDTQALASESALNGPIANFVKGGAGLGNATVEPSEAGGGAGARKLADDRLIANADPCQARAVSLARERGGLVIHGPPGTGKSQTITNIIGDHLARGERVLFVCEKRTALDVVANRLEGIGLGRMCAVVHDPQRDQKDLYMGIRAQLEELAEAKTSSRVRGVIDKLSEEIRTLHEELERMYRALMIPAAQGESFTQLVGEWLALSAHGVDGAQADLDEASLATVPLASLSDHELNLSNFCARAAECGYTENPWTAAKTGTLEQYLARPMDQHRSRMEACVQAARELDAWRDERVPPFDASLPLADQVTARERLKALLAMAVAAPEAIRAHWTSQDAASCDRARATLDALKGSVETLAQARPDPELAAVAGQTPLSEITARLGALEQYLPIAKAWYSFMYSGRKKAATEALRPLGLTLSPENAERAKAFYGAARAALVLKAGLESMAPAALSGAGGADETLRTARAHASVLECLAYANDPSLRGIDVAKALAPQSAELLSALTEGLSQSRAAADRMQALERAAAESGLISAKWIEQTRGRWRSHQPALVIFGVLQEKLSTLDEVLRATEDLARLPDPIARAAVKLEAQKLEFERVYGAIQRGVIAGEISRRLESEPALKGIDGKRIENIFARCAQLQAQKREAMVEFIQSLWTGKQKDRLLAATGSRLNSEGASVRQRLTTRGKNALRLRQVLAMGRASEGGDPLLDLRPVWMASPETVSQLFPREPVFDVVIFDEASQLRLEEALPVLTRARRVVVAGDPKQLPPTRFFESSVAYSESEEIESEEQLFESQQSQTEDLLSAALSLDIEQSYLDVHYRSRNSDLIEFSNEHFYQSRLQAIPGHPKNRAVTAPLSLVRVEGVYEKRVNPAEAVKVCEIIRELLKGDKPPSIGVGCFNIAQRDLISETLDEMAEKDPDFARALAEARARRNRGAAEGLFVKNLENVQGDERDHIIISTTYGPDAQGRFYRRFGPLAMPGGGRRLNVLVTRARERVHLVTSIPRENYLALPPVPQGQTPGGGWLLFSYLQFAEQLQTEYAAIENTVGAAQEGHPEAEAMVAPTHEVVINQTVVPSALATSLALHIKDNASVGSFVHWGNDGFCVDVAMRHPVSLADVTLGIMCDWTRFPNAENPIEWDMFRTAILESQGWSIRRVWSPQVFRDLRGLREDLVARAAEEARKLK